MEFGAELDGSEDFFQMFWPTIISHKIGGNVLENVCVSFYVNKILNLVDKVLIVPSQTKSRPCMKSPRETSQQRCNSKSFSLWRASPQRQATPSRCDPKISPDIISRIKRSTFARWGLPTYPTRSCGVTVSSTPVLPTTRRLPSMLSPSTTSTRYYEPYCLKIVVVFSSPKTSGALQINVSADLILLNCEWYIRAYQCAPSHPSSKNWKIAKDCFAHRSSRLALGSPRWLVVCHGQHGVLVCMGQYCDPCDESQQWSINAICINCK